MNKPESATANSDYIAALDIGSNSFHFVLARQVEQHIQIVHSEKYRVRLAQGLDENNQLDTAAIQRGVTVLESLSTSTQQLLQENFRVVATYTLRQAENAEVFLAAAQQVFPFDIEIITGHEEARLIYQGVAFYDNFTDKRLVIDIGGGSTECIIGNQQEVNILDSLNIGCVSYQKLFFKEGIISEKAFKEATQAAKHEIDAIVKRFKKVGWKKAMGTSGTIKSIYQLLNHNEPIPQQITRPQIVKLKHKLLTFAHIDDIAIEGLKENRRPIICAGVSILIAIMECLEIEALDFCQYALREGVLQELLGDFKTSNVRQRTVTSLIERFNIDTSQAQQVKQLCCAWFEQVKFDWQLDTPIYLELLSAAANLHELGFDINASGYHKHGHYILSQADLAGFNREQQQALAWLVGNQRKKITPLTEKYCYLLKVPKLHRLCVLLRLAVLICQQRQNLIDFTIKMNANENQLVLSVNRQWLVERPLVDIELFYEKEVLQQLGITLKVLSAE